MSERYVDAGRVAAIAALAALAAVAGLLVVKVGYAAVAGGAVIALFIIVVAWPRQLHVSTATGAREVLLMTILLLYLVPLLMLGRVFALVGSNPVYLPDVLLVLASLLMLPKLRTGSIRLVLVLCACIALLMLHAVYVGHEHGYQAATKGLVLAVYPLLAIVVAGWVCGLENPDRVLYVLPRYVLPLITLGLAIVLATNASLISGAYGLYLGIAAAFAVTRGIPGRRILAPSALVGLILLLSVHSARGPTLTVLLAAFSAWLAGSRLRSRIATSGTAVAVLAVIACAALTLSLGVFSATQVPIVGKLVSRVTATTTSENSSAADNVILRKAIWSYALHTTYTESPLLGVGAYHPLEITVRGDNLQSNASIGVHDSFIGYTFYAGYPAGVLVVLVFAIGLWRVWRIRELDIYAPAMFGALVAVVVTSLTNVALETTYIGGPSWLVLATAIGLAGRHAHSSHRL